MMAKLKPCPFCGGKRLFVGTVAEIEMQDEDHPDYSYNRTIYTVCCSFDKGGCGASVGAMRSELDALNAWNRRASE